MEFQSRGALLLSFSLLALCLPAYSRTTSNKPTRAEQEDEIREAVVRYLALGWSGHDRVFFISIEGRDPSDQFLSRLKGLAPQVKKASDSKDVKQENSFFSDVRDKVNDKAGVVFSVETIVWTQEYAAEVPGSYRCGILCGGGSKFRVTRKGHKWVVEPGATIWNA